VWAVVEFGGPATLMGWGRPLGVALAGGYVAGLQCVRVVQGGVEIDPVVHQLESGGWRGGRQRPGGVARVASGCPVSRGRGSSRRSRLKPYL
jgi:hypothetical protein